MVKRYFIVGCMILSSISLAQNIEKPVVQNQFQLTGDVISFPISIVNAFPFIAGEINGVKGKFMFDTGHQDALSINNNIIPLNSQKLKDSGFVASGQKFNVYKNDNIEEVKLVNSLYYQNLKQIESSNYDFLQNNITSDCIGYIGFNFFKGYLFKLDYTKRKLTFYKSTLARESSKDFLKDEKLVAVLNFEIRNKPNIPIVKVKVDNVETLGLFDTGGSYGVVDLSDKNTEKLKKKKYLRDYGKDGYDEDLFILNNVVINHQLTTDFIGIHKIGERESKQFKKAISVTEDDILIFAYRFLAKYKTVWDYENKKIYVLKY